MVTEYLKTLREKSEPWGPGSKRKISKSAARRTSAASDEASHSADEPPIAGSTLDDIETDGDAV